MSLTIFIVVILGLFALAIWIRNNIVRYFNATQRAWADVASYERKKVQTLNELEPVLEKYTQFEKGTLERVTELRSRILSLNSNTQDVGQLQVIESLTKELMKSLNVVVENYPELKADQLYSKMMDEINEENENVTAAITIFNRNVELFNNHIEVFPNNWVNGMTLGKKPIRPFSDAVQQNFDYKPNF